MPWARYEVDFVAEHFAAIPPRERAEAIALYFGLVDVSAKMLLDGRITGPTLHAVGDETGVVLGAKKGRERDKTVRVLVQFGLLERAQNGAFRLPFWRDHHRSRHDVTEERKAAAERKRKSRTQGQLSLSHPKSQRDVTGDVTAGQTRDSRAHAPAGAVTETEELPAGKQAVVKDEGAGLPAGSENEHDPEPELDIDPVDERLGHVASSVRSELGRLRARGATT